ncbi:MAG: hypothetical protein MRECE_30c027, partial [Mycoplasmataceae bacterium CE_OT135]
SQKTFSRLTVRLKEGQWLKSLKAPPPLFQWGQG